MEVSLDSLLERNYGSICDVWTCALSWLCVLGPYSETARIQYLKEIRLDRVKSKSRSRVLQFFKLYAVLTFCLAAGLRMIGLSSVLLTITFPFIQISWAIV